MKRKPQCYFSDETNQFVFLFKSEVRENKKNEFEYFLDDNSERQPLFDSIMTDVEGKDDVDSIRESFLKKGYTELFPKKRNRKK